MINEKEHGNINELANKLKSKYKNNKPFPHIVLDNFLKPRLLNKALKAFPDLEKIKNTQRFNDARQKKLGSGRGDTYIPKEIQKIIHWMNSHEFLDFIQEMTGITEVLIPDPHLRGGGLHQIKRGGLLKIHADFCKSNETHLDRRVNALLYMNKEWEEEYGGHLELWDQNMLKCGKKILPLFNRLVVFNTTDYTFHGHPEPLNCPDSLSRKSMALYYYSNGRPLEEIRPEEKPIQHYSRRGQANNFRMNHNKLPTIRQNKKPLIVFCCNSNANSRDLGIFFRHG